MYYLVISTINYNNACFSIQNRQCLLNDKYVYIIFNNNKLSFS